MSIPMSEVRVVRPSSHPGLILRHEFLEPLNISAGQLARAMGVPRSRIEELVREQRGVTADTALRLGKTLSTSAELWINLQTAHDLSSARLALGEDGLAEVEVLYSPPAEESPPSHPRAAVAAVEG